MCLELMIFASFQKRRIQLLQERHGLQILFDYRVHDHLEDDLDVAGVRGRGEVVVDELAGRSVERDEGGDDEACRRVHVAVCTWRGDEEG